MVGALADGSIARVQVSAPGSAGCQLRLRRHPGPADHRPDHRTRSVRGQRSGIAGTIFGAPASRRLLREAAGETPALRERPSVGFAATSLAWQGRRSWALFPPLRSGEVARREAA